MNIDVRLPSPVSSIDWPFFSGESDITTNISVTCKRDDLIHPLVSGNKWRKLTASLSHVQQLGCRHIVSFGGAYSNHLHALSYACKCLNIQLTAIVRGNYSESLTPTLIDMDTWGTKLHYVNKIEYQKRTNQTYCNDLMAQLNADYLIPEGGSSADCMQGVSKIISEISTQAPETTHMILPVASGGTLAGLVTSEGMPNIELIGVGVLKGLDYLESLVEGLICQHGGSAKSHKSWHINHDFHHGGYAKNSKALLHFVEQFNLQYKDPNTDKQIMIEPIYSGKCFYAVDQLLRANFFPPNSKLMILHTGGLQGAR